MLCTLLHKAENGPPSSRDVHILIPQTCDCVISDAKWDFAHVIGLRILRQAIILDYLRGAQCNHKALLRSR